MPETDLTQESYSFMEASRPQVRTMGLEGLASSVLSTAGLEKWLGMQQTWVWSLVPHNPLSTDL